MSCVWRLSSCCKFRIFLNVIVTIALLGCSVGEARAAAPSPPTNVSATGGTTQVGLSWTAPSGATSYNVYRGTSSGGESSTAIKTGDTSTTYSDTTVTNGTKYYYEIKAVNSSGTSAASSEVNATPMAAPTLGATPAVTTSEVTLTWSSITGATAYNVYRATSSGGEGTTPFASAVTGASYNDTSVSNGTEYFYKLAAVNANGTSSQSAEVHATPIAAPTAPGTTPGNDSVSVSWTASTGATSYNIYRGTSPGGESSTAIKTGQASSPYADSTVTNGTTYYYVIKAVNAGGTSAASSEVNATPELTAPTGVSAALSGSSIKVSWSSVSNSTSYSVFRGTSSGSEASYATGITTTSYTDSGVGAGSTYYYKVEAVSSTSTSALSSEVNETTKAATPTGLAATPGNASVTLTWNASTGATSYNMYRSTSSGGTYSKINGSAITSTTYTDTTAVNGTTYWYKVTSVDAGGESSESGSVSATPIAPPPAPSGLTAQPSLNSVYLSWSLSGNPVGENVWRSTTSGGPYTLVENIDYFTTSCYDNSSGLQAGTTYYYVVTTYNAGGNSSYSNQASAAIGSVTAISCGANVNGTLSSSSPVALFSGTGANANFYSFAGQANETVTITYNTSFSSPSLQVVDPTGELLDIYSAQYGTDSLTDVYILDDTGTYYIQAGSNEAETGTYTLGLSCSNVSPPPQAFGVLTTTGQAMVYWGLVSSATSYNVKRSTTSGGPYTTIANTASEPYTDSSVSNDTTYYYVVSALNSYGESANSNEVNGTPLPAPTIYAYAQSASTIFLDWSYDSNATGYELDVSPDGQNWTVLANTPYTSFYDENLTPDTTYYFRLNESNNSGTSAYGATVSALTDPSAPTGLTATAGEEQIGLSWTAVAGATGYQLYRFNPISETYSQIATLTSGTSYTDTGLLPITYTYYVTAADSAGGVSAASDTASATPTAPNGTAAYQIDSGGPAVGSWIADEFDQGGGGVGVLQTISTAGVVDPAPMAVYQTRYTTFFSNSFTYTIPNLSPGGSYTVRLHFAEDYWTNVGQREFNVSLNGTQVLTNFDIVSAAGGPNQAVVEQFNTTADSNGNITLVFTNVVDAACVNGVEIIVGASAGPDTPSNLQATPGNAQVVLAWTGGNSNSYNVLRSSDYNGPFTQIATGVTQQTYTDTNVVNNEVYYYVVSAVNSFGTSGDSNVASAMPTASTALQIDCGGPAVGAWQADEDFSGGDTESEDVGVDTSGVVNPAPLTVYQNMRIGENVYTLGGLAAGNYTVRLHFAEIDPLTILPGERDFSVAINGTTVLPDFDIIEAAGGVDTAVVEQMSATPDENGNIAIAFNPGAAGVPAVSGVELVSGASPPSAPFNLWATPGNAQVQLTWEASTTATGFNVYRSTTSGGPYTKIGSAAGNASLYDDNSVTNGVTYYYVVTAVGGAGESAYSNEANATPNGTSPTGSSAVVQIDSGGGPIDTWVADTDYSGGTNDYTTTAIDTSGVVDPAPMAVYQSRRFDASGFTYAIPNLTPGAAYTVRLHFAEYDSVYGNNRLENISINGAQVASAFAPIMAAGTINKAVTEQFNASADNTGTITIQFATAIGSVNDCQVNGVEVFSGSSVPSAPYNLTAIPDNNQVSLYWTSVSGSTSFTVLRGTSTGGPYSTVATGLTSMSYVDATAQNGTTYYYVVEGVSAQGASGNSNEAPAEPLAVGAEDYRINCGGYLAAPYQQDNYYTVAGAGSTDTLSDYLPAGQSVNIDLSNVMNPAPEAVYQSRRNNGGGNTPQVIYVLPNLTPGETYTVRLHFAEYLMTAPGQRLFDVSVNNSRVLTNFDIFSAAGGQYKAIAMPFVTTADSNGNITVIFNPEVELAQVNGIEVLSGNTLSTSPPTDLQAAAGNTQVGLTWIPPAAVGSLTYKVKRATTNGGPYTTIATGISTPNYSDPVNASKQTYYYVVSAVSANGESANSNQATPAVPFTLTANPTSITVAPGSTIPCTLTAKSTVGFTNPISLTVTGAPTGLGAWTYPAQLVLQQQAPYPNSTVTVTGQLHLCPDLGTAPGTYPLTITGTSGDYSASTTVTVTVN